MSARGLGQEDLAGGVAQAQGEGGIDDRSAHFAPDAIGAEIFNLCCSHDFFRAFLLPHASLLG